MWDGWCIHGDREGVGSGEGVEDDKFPPPFQLELPAGHQVRGPAGKTIYGSRVFENHNAISNTSECVPSRNHRNTSIHTISRYCRHLEMLFTFITSSK